MMEVGIIKNINKTPDEYNKMIQQYRPKKPKVKDFILAYLVGGTICAIGQIITQILMAGGMDQTKAAPAATVILIFLGALLTGLGVYDEIGQFGGAGAAVPVTGFANAIVSPAMEFKQEGWILGLGAKMYIVAGPVLTYGMVSAFLIGLIKTLLEL